MKTKKPMLKETVGAMYYAFNIPDQEGNFDASTYEETNKTNVVKKIGTTENGDNTIVRASGIEYASFNKKNSVDFAIEVIAFPAKDLAKMRNEIINENGSILVGDGEELPYFAYGKVVKKVGGGLRYEWYPKCQLIENTDDISTSEESFSEQNDTITVRAYKYDGKNYKFYVDSEVKEFSENLTESKFFEKPLLSSSDLDTILETTPSQNESPAA